MSEVSEIIAQQLTDAYVTKKNWMDYGLYINVKDKGAKGDGVTDDTTAFRNGLTDAITQKKPLFIPPGTYLIDFLEYGTQPYASQISIIGLDRNVTIIKKKTADGNPLIQLGSISGTNYTAHVQFENLTFEGIPGNTPAVLRMYDVVRSRFMNCRFKSGIIGVESLGGITNHFLDCMMDQNQIGFDIKKFTSLASGGWPNLNTLTSCVISDNSKWGIKFNDGRLLKVKDCQVEGNGTAGDTDAGGIWVGANIGDESTLFTLALKAEDCWFEANKGAASVVFNGDRNSLRDCYFVANHDSTYDIHIKGGRYFLENCDGDTLKTVNVKEESASVFSGNFIINCDFESLSFDNTKTTMLFGNKVQTKYFISNDRYMWVDASGLLRIKWGVPASDTDGTVVGTQA